MAETSVALGDVLELLRWLEAGLHARGVGLAVQDEHGDAVFPARASGTGLEPLASFVQPEISLALSDGTRIAISLTGRADAQLRERDAREDERRHLAMQVHDSIAQTMTSLAIHAEVLTGVINHGIEETRVMIQRLRPPELASGGLEAALRALLAHASNVEGRVQSDRNPRSDGVPERQALALYRFVEALLEPAGTVSERWQVLLALSCADAREFQLEACIHGDCSALGLARTNAIAEPLEALGGRVTLETSAAAHTVLRAYVPCFLQSRS